MRRKIENARRIRRHEEVEKFDEVMHRAGRARITDTLQRRRYILEERPFLLERVEPLFLVRRVPKRARREVELIGHIVEQFGCKRSRSFSPSSIGTPDLHLAVFSSLVAVASTAHPASSARARGWRHRADPQCHNQGPRPREFQRTHARVQLRELLGHEARLQGLARCGPTVRYPQQGHDAADLLAQFLCWFVGLLAKAR